MNFNKELLFVAGFIIAVVILIQYLSFTLIKKQIKVEVAKRLSYEKSFNEPKQNGQNGQNVSNNKAEKKEENKEGKGQEEEKENDETYDIDTPEELKSDGDSYVNPLHSEKNVTDDENDEE
jgi:hypothetical protein